MACVDRFLQSIKMLECIGLLVTWTMVTDEYQNEEMTTNGRLVKLSIVISFAVVAWTFTILWLILTFTKVYSFLQITPLVNTCVHLVLAACVLASSIVLLIDQGNTKTYTERPGGCVGIACGVLLVVDTLLFLCLKRKTPDANGFQSF